MEEANTNERVACASVISSAITATSKVTSDSGYGSTSNKSGSGSGTQRSSGSSKSHQSSGSSSGFQNASTTNEPGVSSQLGGGGPSAGGSKSKLLLESSKNRKKKSSRNRTSSVGESSSLQKANSQEPLDAGSPLPSSPGGGGTSSSAGGPVHITTADSPSPLGGRCSPTDSKTLQMAALNHALSCMKKFRENNPLAEMTEEAEEEEKEDLSAFWRGQFEGMKAELKCSSEEHSFGAVVSMDDGLVTHITEDIQSILGYPKDMWMGRSFMELVHPKDKMAFASQCTCTSGLVLSQGTAVNSESFFCRLRQYRGLKTSGFGVVDKPLVFFPFQLTLKFKEVEGVPKNPLVIKKAKVSDGKEVQDKKSVYLFIGATRVSSAYKYPEEVMNNASKFTTRHTANCIFGHMDPSAVNYLGHLPQDLIGHSVFDYYHPDDMDLMQGVYEGILAERGRPFKSKPYRFKVYNGTFAMLETDWSCFINPWSWKLEFVIGQHKVLTGPVNPNVFMVPNAGDEEDPLAKIKQVKEQVKQILGETVLHRDPGKQRAIKRKKDLVNLLENLLDQIGNPESSDLSDSVNSGAFSVLDRDSVMLGGISPHHDNHSSSNQSSETPPSYNQLNYRENIERFFMSHPKTTRTSDESGESPSKDLDLPLSTDDDSKGSPRESSGSLLHSGSGNSTEDKNSGQGSQIDGSHLLTEDILYKHNERMEKCMVQRHKETRSTKNSQTAARHRHIEQGERGNHLKRSGVAAGCASSGSSRKAHKQPHLDALRQPQEKMQQQQQQQQQQSVPGMTPVNLWPPYSVANLRSAANTVTTNAGMPMAAAAAGLSNVQYVPMAAPMGGLRSAQNVINGNLCFQPHYIPHYPHQQAAPFPATPNLMYNPLGIMATPQTLTPSVFPAVAPPQIRQLQQPQMLGGGVGLPYPVTGPLVPQLGFGLRPTIPQVSQVRLGGIPLAQTVTTTTTTSATHHSTTHHHQQFLLRSRPPVQVTTSTSSSSSMLTVDSVPRRELRVQQKPAGRRAESVPKKATADFSSSDGFGDTSSGSYSYIKGGKSSDFFSSSPAGDESNKDEEYDGEEDCENWGDVNGNGRRGGRRTLPKPCWLQNVTLTPELSMKYEYEMSPGDLTDILKKDLERLQLIGQQATVNEQLEKLCSELGLDDNARPNLHLEEGSSRFNSSCNEEDEDTNQSSRKKDQSDRVPSSSEDQSTTKNNKKQKDLLLVEHRKELLSPWAYDRMVQIHEENAPFPKESQIRATTTL